MNHGLKILASWILKWTLEVCTSSLNAGCCTSNNNCLTHWRTPGIIWIISNPFRIHCRQSWISLSSVAKTAGRGYPPGFKSGQWAGEAVGPSCPIHCARNTLFKNSRTSRRKCGGAPSGMNHKWILVCRSTSCNSSGRKFRRKLW